MAREGQVHLLAPEDRLEIGAHVLAPLEDERLARLEIGQLERVVLGVVRAERFDVQLRQRIEAALDDRHGLFDRHFSCHGLSSFATLMRFRRWAPLHDIGYN